MTLFTSLRLGARRAAVLSVALIATLILGLFAAPAAHATQRPAGPFSIVITKLEQPEHLGQPGNGLPVVDASAISPPVAGASFAAWKVPGIEVATNTGQQLAAALTPAGAAALVDTTATPDAQGTTDANGDTVLGGLPAGLYYVEETVVPTGFIGSAPFLVLLPLTHPIDRDSWLSEVHVYPKNSRASIILDVFDEHAISLGDTVHWRSISDIPSQKSFTSYVVTQKIDTRLELIGGAAGVAVRLDDTPGAAGFAGGGSGTVAGGSGAARLGPLNAAPPMLTPELDYSRSYDPASHVVTIDFLPGGLAKLAAAVAADPATKVVLDYDTEVLAEGELRNIAELRVDGAAAVTDVAETRWGPIEIIVHLRGDPAHLIKGARFQLFLSAQDAAVGRNPITVSGLNEWVTDANGEIYIHGLRFSNYVDGLDRGTTDPLFRPYYVIMTFVPTGYQADIAPISLTVTSSTHAQIAVVEIWRDGGGGGGDIPVTGGQAAGMGVLAALLVVGGALLLARRRRDRQSHRAETLGGSE